MSTVAFPSTGAWINSCLVGANSYKILSTQEEMELAFLEEGNGIDRLGGEHRYARVATSPGKNEAWMVLFSLHHGDMHRLADVLELVQVNQLYQNGFFWPFDLAWDGDVKGCLIHPIDTLRYQSIRSYLGRTDVPHWQLARSLFHRLEVLHAAGLTLNGFAREQVRVDSVSGEVFLWPFETCSLLDEQAQLCRETGFLAVPRSLSHLWKKWNQRLSGAARDIFSAAVLTFYLLYCIHPFVGGAFWPLMRSDYISHYHNYPAYIFDPAGDNGLGFLDFEQEITAQWKATTPALRAMFDGVFLDIAHPDRAAFNPSGPHWNPARWIEALIADEESGRPASQYPFETIKNYQV